MIIGVPKETYPGERRVALIPALLKSVLDLGCEVVVEHGAGAAACFPDSAYAEKGAQLADRGEVFAKADVLVQVRALAANLAHGGDDRGIHRAGQAVIAFIEPLSFPEVMVDWSHTGITALSMELMPRITRAQSMDALSSMATVAGYKAVLLAANLLPRLFPMLMTAAGTVTPARVFVIGAGVAGLQAIATARRLGAVVEAYDVRPAVKEQVESLAAKFIELPLDAGQSEDKGGYAKAMGEDFYRKQREKMAEVLTHTDIVIATAAIPGKKSPLLITREMLDKMPISSVIIDLAAERGGNCEATVADQSVVCGNATVLGPTNLASEVPMHASQLYAKNVVTFLKHLVKDKQLQLKEDDEITRETLVLKGGKVVHQRINELLAAKATPSS